jgi:hypothetical protein
MHVPGGHTGGATPVPIPNTEVKPSKADATAAVRPWESRTLPGFKRAHERSLVGLFLLLNDTGRKERVKNSGMADLSCSSAPLPPH